MLGLKEQVFGTKGFSSDLKLSDEELVLVREKIQAQWLSVIKNSHPELVNEANKIGIEHYHLISNQINHTKLWPKSSRVLPQESVNLIKNLPFFSTLRKEFGDFNLADIYDTHQHHGHEEVYWRLVRPHTESDVGPLHKDKWFHGAFNSGYGMFSDKDVTVKIWIPICCEPGKSGLLLSSGSHLKEWEYRIEVTDGIPRPKPLADLSDAQAVLIPTAPGNLIIFNEGVLHGGALNTSNKTRVSAEITMVLPKN